MPHEFCLLRHPGARLAFAALTTGLVLGGCAVTPASTTTRSVDNVSTRPGDAAAMATQARLARAAEKINPGPSAGMKFATDRVSPALVRIDVVAQTSSGGQDVSARAIGSGVIIDNDGHVLTNFHVAGQASRLEVTLANQEHVHARLVGSDHWTDLALIQLDMEEVRSKGYSFQYAPLGESNDVQLAQPVLAMGTPYGLSRTVTGGIISNSDRYFAGASIEGYETGGFNNWLQTDAAINPGNSGGPLVNLRGEVIGINTRGVSEGNNLGFAIPIDVAKYVIRQILAHGRVTRSYVGVQLQPLQDLERYYDINANRGVLIRDVEPDSPAKAAGVQPEDVLLAINGEPVTARFPEQLAGVRRMIADAPVSSTLSLTLQRQGAGPEKPVTVKVKTERLESVMTRAETVGSWGISARNLTRAYLRQQRLPLVAGVLVTGVRDGSPAQTAGLKEDDIIMRVAEKPVKNVEELKAAVQQADERGKPVLVDIRRDRSQQVLVLRPEAK